jgi:hypothetical protein
MPETIRVFSSLTTTPSSPPGPAAVPRRPGGHHGRWCGGGRRGGSTKTRGQAERAGRGGRHGSGHCRGWTASRRPVSFFFTPPRSVPEVKVPRPHELLRRTSAVLPALRAGRRVPGRKETEPARLAPLVCGRSIRGETVFCPRSCGASRARWCRRTGGPVGDGDDPLHGHRGPPRRSTTGGRGCAGSGCFAAHERPDPDGRGVPYDGPRGRPGRRRVHCLAFSSAEAGLSGCRSRDSAADLRAREARLRMFVFGSALNTGERDRGGEPATSDGRSFVAPVSPDMQIGGVDPRLRADKEPSSTCSAELRFRDPRRSISSRAPSGLHRLYAVEWATSGGQTRAGRGDPPAGIGGGQNPLTGGSREVLRLLAEGLQNKAISRSSARISRGRP